jgi:hypothetical protein
MGRQLTDWPALPLFDPLWSVANVRFEAGQRGADVYLRIHRVSLRRAAFSLLACCSGNAIFAGLPYGPYCSTNTYSCWASRMISTRLCSRSLTTNSNPCMVGEMVTKLMLPSSFLRDAT